MSWFTNLFRRDAKRKPARVVRVARVRNLIDPTLNYAQTTNGARWAGEGFDPAEYDLTEIGQVEDTESLVMQAHKKKVALMFKEGHCFFSQNLKAKDYIEKRIAQIGRASGKSWNAIVRSLGHDLVRTSNAFLVKTRILEDSKGRAISGGKIRKTPEDQKLKPVAAYHRLSPETVEIKRSKSSGKITHYRQIMPDGSKKIWSKDSIVHFVFNQKGHFNVGTPMLVPVLDDIRALRRIEQNVEILVYQHLFPLYQYTVGDKDMPADVYTDGEAEIDLVRREVELLPAEGMIVTPFHHSIEAIGAEGKALKIEGYLEYFKKRIVAGLGMSQVDFGDGATANRATADNMSRLLIDDVKDYQEVLSDQIQTFIISELLLESTFEGDVLGKDFAVGHRFKEIDVDTKIKKENAALLLYQGNAITEDELREALNRNPLTDEERQKLFMNVVEQPMMEKEGELAIKVGNALPKPAAAGASPSSGGSAKTKATKKAVKTKSQPTNQHKTNPGPTKKKSYRLADRSFRTRFNELEEDVLGLYGRDGERVNTDYVRQIVLGGARQVKDEYRGRVVDAMARGARKGGLVNGQATILAETRAAPLIDRFDFDVSRLYRDVNRLVGRILLSNSNDKESEIKIAFNSLRYRTKFIEATDMARAENFGRARALAALGFDEAISIQHGDTDDICAELHGQPVDIRGIGIDQVPPYHPMCNCELVQPEQTNDN